MPWFKVVMDAMEIPLKHLAINAGLNANDVISECMNGIGFNAKTRTFSDLQEDGILDAASVLKSSVMAAGSVASLVILAEVLIADDEL